MNEEPIRKPNEYYSCRPSKLRVQVTVYQPVAGGISLFFRSIHTMANIHTLGYRRHAYRAQPSDEASQGGTITKQVDISNYVLYN